MINKELFYELLKVPRGIKLKPAPRLIAKPEATAACILEKGFVYECYPMDSKYHIVSWFWKSGDIIIPSSPYSNLVMTDDGKYSHILYKDMIRKLRAFEEFRTYYREIREAHNEAIAGRINDMKKLSPLENYIKLLETKPWVLGNFSDEGIASYLNVRPEVLKRFMSTKA